MIKIEKEDVQKALRYFGVEQKVAGVKILSDDQEERKGKLAVRIVTVAELENQEKLIVKFLNERAFILDVTHLQITTETIEKQAAFSEILRREGMIVPKRYQRNQSYCMPMEIEGVPLDVTVEEFLGQPMKEFSPDLFYTYGCLIGKIHRISLEQGCRIDFSIVFQEWKDNRTEFGKLFSGVKEEILPKELIAQLAKQHDIYKETVMEIWQKLPRSAVQGDLYSNNNVALTEDGIGFYDFNVAADEVLLGDMLHVWFRTIYDVNNEKQIKDWNLGECWQSYENGYTRQREWSEKEKQALPTVMALLDMIYHARYAADLMRHGRVEEGRWQLEQMVQRKKATEGIKTR